MSHNKKSANEREDRELWSRKAAFWNEHIGDEGDRNRRLHLHPVIWRMLGDVEGQTILDAGCGTGYLGVMLAQKGANVTAVDYAPGMIEQAKARASRLQVELDLHIDNCCTLETISDSSLDKLVSNYVLQDLEDLAGAISAFARVLKKGGVAVLVFSHPCFEVPGGPTREKGAISYTWHDSYFKEQRHTETWQGRHHQTGEAIDFSAPFTYYHRPLSTYFRHFLEAGFVCLDFDEPVVQPPYPPEWSPEELHRYTQAAWSIAFKLQNTRP